MEQLRALQKEKVQLDGLVQGRVQPADVQRRLVQTDRYGRRLPAARPDQVDEARRLLAGLGIAHRL